MKVATAGSKEARELEKLKAMVNERARTGPFILPIVDESGNTTLLQFASLQDRVTKDGASNHKVLDKNG